MHILYMYICCVFAFSIHICMHIYAHMCTYISISMYITQYFLFENNMLFL